MEKDIVAAWDQNKNKVREWIEQTDLSDITYCDLLRNTIKNIFPEKGFNSIPDHNRITEIDYGYYQGTLVFIIGGQGDQPSIDEHWYTSVYYGSCSGCDTLQAIQDDMVKNQNDEYFSLCLHLIQKMKRMSDVSTVD